MEEIAQSYSVNNFWVAMHYGPSRGGAVVLIGDNLPKPGVIDDTWREWYVADIVFHWIKPVMWEDGLFYDLQEAYDLNLLTREDLKSVAERFNPNWVE